MLRPWKLDDWKALFIRREIKALKEKLMDKHQVRTGIEGLGVAIALGLLNYAGENAADLMSGDKHKFFAGAITAGLGALVVYIKARYTAPPDVQEKIDRGDYPEQRDLATRQERTEGGKQ